MSDMEKIPHDCPVCGLMLRDMNDVLSFEDYRCCTDCQDRFVYRDLDGWMRGIRPSGEEVQEFRKELLKRASYLPPKT